MKNYYLGSFFIISILSLFFAERVLSSSESDFETSKIRQIKVDDATIYSASVQLKSGEIVHFGCEPIISKERSSQWATYADWADHLSKDPRGYLNTALTFISQGQTSFLQDKMPSEVLDLLKNVADPKKLQATLSGVCSGTAGMHKSVGTWITYVSKKEITGFFPFKKLVKLTEVESNNVVEHFVTYYDDLIMSVSSFNHTNEIRFYEHRGIFRNPISILRKDYRGLGLLIHIFTGVARSLNDPNLVHMTVRPNSNEYMRKLLLANFTSDNMYPGEQILNSKKECYAEFHEKFTVEAAQAFIEHAGFTPEDIAIKLTALKALSPIS